MMSISAWHYLQMLLLLALSVTPSLCYVACRKWRWSMVWAYVMALMVCYLLLVAAAKATNGYLYAVLQSYDVDGDGSFDGHEINPAQQQAMDAVTSDTGRAMVILTGVFISPILTGIGFGLTHLLVQGYVWFISKISRLD